ncbi:MAG: M28 family peptidase [Desulfurococcaceae archaeon]|nr:M28 family peptidase [Sulfolobales archaeon]MDW8170054.1 M28 family peptidase [Desulfurococcaceae archaeon]
MNELIIGREVFEREIVAGSAAELDVVHALKELFEELGGDDVYLEPLPVMTWIEDECFIEAPELRIKCLALPYSLSIDVEARSLYVHYYGNSIALREDPVNKIAIAPYPDELDDAKYVLLKLAKAGATAVVFYDNYPGRVRRIVVCGSKGYSYIHGSPPPIPAVAISKESLLKLAKSINGGALRLYIKTRVVHSSTGYNVVSVYNGSLESEVILSAHHDHWLKGYSDDLIGLESLAKVALKLKNIDRKHTYILISFTAEESGAPGYASWYWSWGSRKYLEGRLVKRDLDKIALAVNIDAVFTTPLRASINPFIWNVIKKLVDLSYISIDGATVDQPMFDSYSFTTVGVPALTLHTFNELKPNYHTNLDDGREWPPNLVEKVVEAISSLLKTVDSYNINELYKLDVSTFINDLLGDAPVETLILLMKLRELKNLEGKVAIDRFVRDFTKNFIKASSDCRLGGRTLSSITPEIYLLSELIKEVREGLVGEVEVSVIGAEEVLFNAYVNTHTQLEVLKSMYVTMASVARKYLDYLNNIVSSSLIH